MGYSCAVYGCLSCKRDKDRSFYRFPKDKIRCKQWIKASSRKDLEDKSEEDLYKSFIICDLHFEKSNRIGTRLTCNAIPTLMLPAPQEDSLFSKSTQTFNIIVSTMKLQTSDVVNSGSSTDHTSEDTQTTEELTNKTPRKRKLLQAYATEVKRRRVLEKELHKVATASELKEDTCLTPQMQSIIDLQKKLHPHSRGNTYTKEFKLFALSVFFAGPMAYRVISKMMCLPSERTLRRINMNTGTKISPNVINCLKSKLKHLKESEKYCVICADEMSLKQHLFYQINMDKVVGFHEIDGIQTTEIATQAFVVMARGIFQNWKQPLGYSFLAQSKNYAELNRWLDDVISEMFCIGFKVVAFVSDQGSIFLNLATSRNVTVETPYFSVNGHKIYYIFDVPYLIKSLRNNLLKYDIEYKDEHENKAIGTWSDIKTFYAQDSKRKYRLAPKLTESHINPNNFEKMKVKYATQVFSKTVAAGMSCSIEMGKLKNEGIGTVKLIELINNTFDILNSSVVKDPNKYKKAFSGLSHQMETLNKFIKFLNDVTIWNTENKKDVTNSVKCLKGFKISLASIMSLWEDLSRDGYKFVFTRRLNKDVLENFFGSVRQQGGNCRNPTPVQFSRAFRKLFILNMLKHSEYANCKDDMDNLLINLDEIVTAHVAKHQNETPCQIECDNGSLIAVNRSDYRFDMPEQNAVQYVCGYLLRACHDIHKCEGINAYIKSAENNVFTHCKAYNVKNNYFGGLKYLPDTFVEFIKALDKCVVKVFNRKQFLGCLGKEILGEQSNIAFVDCCSCFPTEYLKKLFVRFRIYNVIGFNNRLLRTKSFKYKYLSVSNL